MKMEDLVNLVTVTDMIQSLLDRAAKLSAGMKQAVAENRDLTDDEVEGFRADSEAEDQRLEDAIEAKRQREVVGQDSDKITGEHGGDIRP